MYNGVLLVKPSHFVRGIEGFSIRTMVVTMRDGGPNRGILKLSKSFEMVLKCYRVTGTSVSVRGHKRRDPERRDPEFL